MSEFDTYECTTCGDEFKAYPDSNAAQEAACSPACHSAA
jgi:DNA-directed RNA polymerase subunit RPC12/RpoP